MFHDVFLPLWRISEVTCQSYAFLPKWRIVEMKCRGNTFWQDDAFLTNGRFLTTLYAFWWSDSLAKWHFEVVLFSRTDAFLAKLRFFLPKLRNREVKCRGNTFFGKLTLFLTKWRFFNDVTSFWWLGSFLVNWRISEVTCRSDTSVVKWHFLDEVELFFAEVTLFWRRYAFMANWRFLVKWHAEVTLV